MNEKNLVMTRGDTYSFAVEIEGLCQDLDTAFFTCKVKPTATEMVFQKTLSDGITKVGTNTQRVRVAPEDTQTIAPGKYAYDLQIGVNSDIYTILKGTLLIEQDVTF